jgi:predicted cation transporter
LDAFPAARNPQGDSVAMNTFVGMALIGLLLLGPVLSRLVEEQIEAFFLAIGLLAMTLAGAWRLEIVRHALLEPVWITLAVIVAGVVFDHVRGLMDRAVARMRARVAGRLLCAGAVFVIALLSSLITAIVAALVLVEVVGLLRLESRARLRVTVAGCFAIGLGASLTPLGEPLSTLAADALGLDFTGLFRLLAPYVLPGMLACSITAGLFASNEAGSHAGAGATPAATLALAHLTESFFYSCLRGLRVYVFVAALVLVSHAFSDLALRFVPLLSREQLFWANTVSAVMDNATLVALEVHSMDPVRAREAIIALLVAGGMLVPGNIPNIVAAAALRIRAAGWAKIGLPIGLVMLGIYFALLEVAG